MKSIQIKWLAGWMLLLVVASSCKKDLLDIYPSDALSDVTVFNDIQLANRFLNNIYGTMPHGYGRRDQNPIDANWSRGMTALAMATDDAEGNNLASSTHGINQGVIPTTWAYAEDVWNQNYAVIRKANQFMENIDNVPGDASVKNRMKAEARFLRAISYEQLVKWFGGVPLMLSAGTPEESIIPRNTYDECIAQIIKDCDESAAVLEPAVPENDRGRATRMAALSLKARVLLYYASPLNNPGNTTSRWTDAAAAARAALAYSPVAGGTGQYDLYPDFYRLFIDKQGNNEVIFTRRFQNPGVVASDGARYKWYMSVPGINDGAWGGFVPSQNLVDAFEMKNGMKITDAGSGYDPQNPYANRDNRLSKSILHQGSVYKNGIVIETYRGGNTNNNTRFDSSKTGYGLLKTVDTSKYGAAGFADNDWIFLRLAEVMLNYAEAQNEASGPDASVYEALNYVRQRAGQPAVSGLNQEQMRAHLLNERRVELAFEEHRFFDVRRWKLGTVYFREPIRKVQITRTPDGQLIYNYPVWEQRQFFEFQNVLPIPQAEIDRNGLLEQNPEYN